MKEKSNAALYRRMFSSPSFVSPLPPTLPSEWAAVRISPVPKGRLETCGSSTVLPFVEAPTQLVWAGTYFTGIRMHTSCAVCLE